MADRTSCEIFTKLMELLGNRDQWDSKELALEIWNFSRDYDFAPVDLDCDEELLKLGLAKRGIDPEYPEDGEQTLYRSYNKEEEFSR